MKKIILYISFSAFLIGFSQKNEEKIPDHISKYYEILNYIPSSIQKIEGEKTDKSLNNSYTIGMLKANYEMQNISYLSTEEVEKWNQEIQDFATAMYNENRPVLLKIIGEYGGCNEKLLETKSINNIEVSVVKFCMTCTPINNNLQEFVQKFNSTMFSLLETEVLTL